ncbi:MAG: L,D-transpeptidase [Oscillatoriales cyanobacterium RM1_1_9]|nr:L,D-transpeptidase [Oscillatoriales cyanobacterium SM2_3_0]NJO46097.1 L,D-transpeptidase [Oscillatoriales cyanobacterium RM2_1_1]NJO70699.1 L,D-transpeptidase [Oscillatoriales cyanobacterium RM1_1_9]
MSQDRGLMQRVLGGCMGAIAMLGLSQAQVLGSTPVSVSENLRQATTTGAAIIPAEWLNPSLPSLDDPSIFLPSQQVQTRLILRLGERRVYLYRGNQAIVSYPVAIGKAGWETPTGSFKVIQKIVNPSWQNPWTGEVMSPGPNSALGLRWIGFWTDGKDTIGFHGTPTINSIGRAASHGCVRMRNEDIVALFEQVEMGTLVMVEP